VVTGKVKGAGPPVISAERRAAAFVKAVCSSGAAVVLPKKITCTA